MKKSRLTFKKPSKKDFDGAKFKWSELPDSHTPISEGDLRIVEIPVKVLFEWSDKIVVDHDYPESDWVEYGSGWVMKVLEQSVVYNNQEALPLASTFKTKTPEVNTDLLSKIKAIANGDGSSQERMYDIRKLLNDGK